MSLLNRVSEGRMNGDRRAARLREYATRLTSMGTDEGSAVPLAWLKEVRLTAKRPAMG